MNIKYNKKQQELRDDPVLDSLLKTKEFVNKNSNTVTGIVIAIVVILGIGLSIIHFKNVRGKNAREEFGKAMAAYSEQNMESAVNQFKMVAENFRGSVSGTMGAYMLASILYSQGRFDEAITWYETVLKGANIGFMSAQVNEGLATCYEAKSDNATAIKYLEKALQDNGDSFRHNAIRWKLAILAKESDPAKSIKLCNDIIAADTVAQNYRQEAKFLKAALEK